MVRWNHLCRQRWFSRVLGQDAMHFESLVEMIMNSRMRAEMRGDGAIWETCFGVYVVLVTNLFL